MEGGDERYRERSRRLTERVGVEKKRESASVSLLHPSGGLWTAANRPLLTTTVGTLGFVACSILLSREPLCLLCDPRPSATRELALFCLLVAFSLLTYTSSLSPSRPSPTPPSSRSLCVLPHPSSSAVGRRADLTPAL